MPKNKRNKHYKWLWLGLVIIVSFLYLIFARIGVDVLHDGIMFKAALDVSQGKELYKDVVTQYGALTTLLQAAAIKVSGPHVLSIRYQAAVFYMLSVIVLWFVWIKIMPNWLASFTSLLFILMGPFYFWTFHPWSSVYALFFQSLAILFLVRYLDGKKIVELFLTGIAAALVFWCRQPVGIFLIVAILAFLCIKKLLIDRKTAFVYEISVYVGGLVAISIPFFIWLLFSGLITDWWLQTIKLAVSFAQIRGVSISYILVCLFPNIGLIWSILAVCIMVIFCRTSYLLLKKEKLKNTDIAVYAISIIALASWLQYYPIACYRHLYWSAAPMFGAIAYFYYDLLKGQKIIYRSILTILLLSGCFYTEVVGRVSQGITKLKGEYIIGAYPEVLKGLKLTQKEATINSEIALEVDKYMVLHPEKEFLNLTPDFLYITYYKDYKHMRPKKDAKTYGFILQYYGVDPIYRDYAGKLSEYINNYHPLVLSYSDRELVPLNGYKRIKQFENGFTLLAYPENLKAVK